MATEDPGSRFAGGEQLIEYHRIGPHRRSHAPQYIETSADDEVSTELVNKVAEDYFCRDERFQSPIKVPLMDNCGRQESRTAFGPTRRKSVPARIGSDVHKTIRQDPLWGEGQAWGAYPESGATARRSPSVPNWRENLLERSVPEADFGHERLFFSVLEAANIDSERDCDYGSWSPTRMEDSPHFHVPAALTDDEDNTAVTASPSEIRKEWPKGGLDSEFRKEWPRGGFVDTAPIREWPRGGPDSHIRRRDNFYALVPLVPNMKVERHNMMLKNEDVGFPHTKSKSNTRNGLHNARSEIPLDHKFSPLTSASHGIGLSLGGRQRLSLREAAKAAFSEMTSAASLQDFHGAGPHRLNQASPLYARVPLKERLRYFMWEPQYPHQDFLDDCRFWSPLSRTTRDEFLPLMRTTKSFPQGSGTLNSPTEGSISEDDAQDSFDRQSDVLTSQMQGVAAPYHRRRSLFEYRTQHSLQRASEQNRCDGECKKRHILPGEMRCFCYDRRHSVGVLPFPGSDAVDGVGSKHWIADDPDEIRKSHGKCAGWGGRFNRNEEEGEDYPHPLYIVEFKNGRVDFFFVPPTVTEPIKVGDLVIVEADRGKDLGKVICTDASAPRDPQGVSFREKCSESAQRILLEIDGIPQPNYVHPKRIYRLAVPSEVTLLSAKKRDEASSIRVCKSKVLQKNLPMYIVDAEYQWDRRKLTFYFVSQTRIDFRGLVRELFKLYKTRIWMCAIMDHKPLQRHERAAFTSGSNRGTDAPTP